MHELCTKLTGAPRLPAAPIRDSRRPEFSNWQAVEGYHRPFHVADATYSCSAFLRTNKWKLTLRMSPNAIELFQNLYKKILDFNFSELFREVLMYTCPICKECDWNTRIGVERHDAPSKRLEACPTRLAPSSGRSLSLLLRIVITCFS